MYAKLLEWVKERHPKIITHSYSPEEIDFISNINDRSITYTLEYLKDHGLDTIPGTAAEILVDESSSSAAELGSSIIIHVSQN